MTDIEHRLDVLEHQMKALRQQQRDLQEWVDTISTRPLLRLFWFLSGWRLWSEGRWYKRKYQEDNDGN
jgi:hypothetical protein